MKKYIFLLVIILLGITACEKPEEGLTPATSVNAQIVRFRIYQNQNVFFDGNIDNEESIVTVTIPARIDKTTIYPQIMISEGATINPASAVKQDFTTPVQYTVTSENGKVTTIYEVRVIN
jgi:hypothetical protein